LRKIPPLFYKELHIREKGSEKNEQTFQQCTRRRCMTVSSETSDRMVNAGVAGADHLKIQTAEALEEAARKLRRADVAVHGEDVKQILHDVEDRVSQFKAEVGAQYDTMEAGYHQTVEPVENIIIDHPIPAVLIAAGVGVLIGMLIFKIRD
jgi:ElaB/YqjD/DUF883 family membrane-anchored ribosome-binding protein